MSNSEQHGLKNRIRECATIVGSGDELSRLSKVPRRTLENYLSGRSEPKASALAAIAVAARVNLNWLLLGIGARDIESETAHQVAAVTDEEGIGYDRGLMDAAIRECLETLASMPNQVSAADAAAMISAAYRVGFRMKYFNTQKDSGSVDSINFGDILTRSKAG